MKTSSNGLNLIKEFEGLRLVAYKPVSTEKYWTIGYGHCGPEIKKDMKITQAQADNYLKQDLAKFEKAVNDSVKVALTQNQFDSLVSFTYNCGVNALKSSTLLKKLNRGDYLGCADEFLRWNKSGNTVIAGLTKRRNKERALFLSGDSYEAYTTASALNVRAGIGTNYKIVKTLPKNSRITILETNLGWGKIKDGWVSLQYTRRA